MEKTLNEIFTEFQDVFHISGEVLSVSNFYTEHMQTTDSTPVYMKIYRLPQSQMEEIIKQVDQLLDNILEHSISPHNSALLVVPNKILAIERTGNW